jgi:hypothetical protein
MPLNAAMTLYLEDEQFCSEVCMRTYSRPNSDLSIPHW